MKNGRYFNFRDICDRNLWDTGYLVKKLQGYGILRPPPPLMGHQACKKRYYKTVDNADISFDDQLSNVELTKVSQFVFHQKLLPQTAQFHL